MTLLKVTNFKGLRPQIASRLLPPGSASVATDIRLTSGSLTPLLGWTDHVTLNGAPQVKSVYRFGQSTVSNTQYWFQSTLDVDWAKGPVDNDTVERTYFTDGVFPKKTDSTLALGAPPYPSASYAIGVPVPAGTISVSVTGSPTNPADPAETVVLVCTYVSSWGEEGPPSAASAPVSWRPGQTLNLTGIPGAPGTGPQGQNYNITGKRVYRSATGTSATQYQLDTSLGTAGTIPIATTTGSSTLATSGLGDVLPSVGWVEAPYNMIGLKSGPNGMMAGFVGNTLCFCEPNLPYAWPVRYQKSTDAPIVGIEWFDQSLFVGTTRGIYIFTGVDPANMTMQKLGLAQSLAAKRALVAMNGGVIFASPDGLFKCDGGGVGPLTEGVLSRGQWQAYNPSSMQLYESDGRCIVFYDNGTKAGLIFDFGEPASFSTTTQYAYGAFRDRLVDALFGVRDTGNHLASFDTGSVLASTWTSSVFQLPSPENMGAALVECNAYPVTFKLYTDDSGVQTLRHTQVVTNNTAFRLPSGYRASSYYFEITNPGAVSTAVRRVLIGTTMSEITRGDGG